MLIQLSKVLQRLHLNRLAYHSLKPVYKMLDRSNANMTEVEAEHLLQQKAPDPANSALCHNVIVEPAVFDLQIVIPVYKVEEYIEQCVDSILNQPTQYKVLVVLVNDASPDNSRSIISRKYEQMDNIMVIDQENKGLSGARNAGIQTIRGRYVMFVDSDDYLLPGSIDSLMDAAIEQDADIVEGGYFMFYGSHNLMQKHHSAAVWQSDQEVLAYQKAGLYGFAWGKVYRARLWSNLQFPERYWFEDTINSFLVFPKAQKIATIDTQVYAYRKNMKGISVTSHKKMRVIETLWITRQLMADWYDMEPSYSKMVFDMLIGQICINHRRLENLGDQQICHANFVLSKSLVDAYFPEAKEDKLSSRKKKQLLKALCRNDYAEFRMTALFLNS